MNKKFTRMLVVDDHGVVRQGLATLLERRSNFKVVGSAATGEDAVTATRRLRPDVVVMDLMLPQLNGIEATKLIMSEFPGTLIIALSSSKTPGHIERALSAGARGYVFKDADGNELLRAVDQVLMGNWYVSTDAAMTADSVPAAYPKHRNPLDSLSAREHDILQRVIAGYTSAAIGLQLSLSRKTIETYRGRLMVKLGVADRAALIRLTINYELPVV